MIPMPPTDTIRIHEHGDGGWFEILWRDRAGVEHCGDGTTLVEALRNLAQGILDQAALDAHYGKKTA